MQDPVRLFVSVDVKVTDAMRDVLSELRSVKGVRAAGEGQIHITLCFLGDTDPRRVPGLIDSMRRGLSDVHAFKLRIEGMGAFPNVRRPRVVWFGITEGSDELAQLSAKVCGAVDSQKLHRDGKRFSPHVTAGRIQGQAEIKEIVDGNAETVFSEFTVDSVRLMKSVLGPNGAKHTVLERFPLGE